MTGQRHDPNRSFAIGWQTPPERAPASLREALKTHLRPTRQHPALAVRQIPPPPPRRPDRRGRGHPAIAGSGIYIYGTTDRSSPVSSASGSATPTARPRARPARLHRRRAPTPADSRKTPRLEWSLVSGRIAGAGPDGVWAVRNALRAPSGGCRIVGDGLRDDRASCRPTASRGDWPTAGRRSHGLRRDPVVGWGHSSRCMVQGEKRRPRFGDGLEPRPPGIPGNPAAVSGGRLVRRSVAVGPAGSWPSGSGPVANCDLASADGIGWHSVVRRASHPTSISPDCSATALVRQWPALQPHSLVFDGRRRWTETWPSGAVGARATTGSFSGPDGS